MVKKTAVSILFSFLFLFILFGGFHTNLLADDFNSTEEVMFKKHITTTERLREAVVASSQARSANIEKLEKQLSKWGFDATQVKTAVRTLTDAELEYLVRRSENAGQNLFGGAVKGETVGLIVLGGVAAFIVIWQVTKLSAGSGWAY